MSVYLARLATPKKATGLAGPCAIGVLPYLADGSILMLTALQ